MNRNSTGVTDNPYSWSESVRDLSNTSACLVRFIWFPNIISVGQYVSDPQIWHGASSSELRWQKITSRLYIDQPIGVGYSYGEVTIKTSSDAAIAIYNALQLFYRDPAFSKYAKNDFGLWTESFGGESHSMSMILSEHVTWSTHNINEGHYGPHIVDLILKMNDRVATTGNLLIPVKSLGIGNGNISPPIQYAHLMEYAKHNPVSPRFLFIRFKFEGWWVLTRVSLLVSSLPLPLHRLLYICYSITNSFLMRRYRTSPNTFTSQVDVTTCSQNVSVAGILKTVQLPDRSVQ